MIYPKLPQTISAVAEHYDELDDFYRDIWGEHVHHGYWPTGRETASEAVVALIELLARRLRLSTGQQVCDIGCGYGATARLLAERSGVDVIGVTVSVAQMLRARAPEQGHVVIRQQDWLTNSFPSEHFDRSYAIESSEHMPDKQGFFNQAFRTLKPGGLLVVCAWLARDHPREWEVRHLLEPICREGRLPSMGDETDYRHLAAQAGFRLRQVEDLSDQVRRTWWICARRVVIAFVTQARYRRFMLSSTSTNRVFALTLLRILIAYHTRSMRYCLFVFARDAPTQEPE